MCFLAAVSLLLIISMLARSLIGAVLFPPPPQMARSTV